MLQLAQQMKLQIVLNLFQPHFETQLIRRKSETSLLAGSKRPLFNLEVQIENKWNKLKVDWTSDV